MSLGTRARITTVVIIQDDYFHDEYVIPDKFEELDDEAYLLDGSHSGSYYSQVAKVLLRTTSK